MLFARINFVGMCVCVVCLFPIAVAGQPVSTISEGNITIGLTRITGDLDIIFDNTLQSTPTDYTVVPGTNGRALVSTLGGVIRVVERDGTILPAFLDTRDDPIASEVGWNIGTTNGEFGLHSIKVHPDFAVSGAAGQNKFFTLGSRGGEGSGPSRFLDGGGSNNNSVLIEWTVTTFDENVLEATSRQVFSHDQPAQAHNIVSMAFDRFGLLYLTSGDGGTGNGLNGGQSAFEASQDARNLFGAVIRIDPLDPDSDPFNNNSYSVPADNIFAADGNGSTLGEIYALGLRSPFRASFDRQDVENQQVGEGLELYVGNVGAGTIETVFRIGAGENARWGRFEGSQLVNPGVNLNTTASQLADNLFEYNHNLGRCIIGGFVYRGSRIPELQGKYVFGDLGEARPTARLFYLDIDSGDASEFVIDEELGTESELPRRLISIAEDGDGELLLLVGTDPRTNGTGQNGVEGAILRVGPDLILGDVNQDGAVNLLDVGPFVEIIINNLFQEEADINLDGAVDLLDVGPFVDLLSDG